jgi:hypothetical protein
MEAICSSETSGATQRTTRRHSPEDDTPRNHRCENLKSYLGGVVLQMKHSGGRECHFHRVLITYTLYKEAKEKGIASAELNKTLRNNKIK